VKKKNKAKFRKMKRQLREAREDLRDEKNRSACIAQEFELSEARRAEALDELLKEMNAHEETKKALRECEQREVRIRQLSRCSDLLDFSIIAKHNTPETPGLPSDEVVRLRYRLVAEEFFETVEALFDDPLVGLTIASAKQLVSQVIEKGPISRDPARFVLAADGFLDTSYTAEGAMVSFGIDSDALWDVVHQSNMAKKGGPFVNGKLCKPLNWTPPDIAGELKRQGWLNGTES
jgi:predicted HAD superfamily Cof-like phosphohydrolase